MSRFTTCPTCGTYGYIPPAAPMKTTPYDPNRRKVATGETFDLAPHEVVELLTPEGTPLMTIDGGNSGMQRVRIG